MTSSETTYPERVAVLIGVFLCTVLGWALWAWVGIGAGLALALLTLVVRWRGQPTWRWVSHALRRRAPIRFSDPITVANDRTGGGLRHQDGVAVAVVQVLGASHQPTVLTGSTGTETVNTLDIGWVLPMLRQSLGLRVESASVVIAGSRRCSTGDYPRLYDTLVGTVPYAGQRETWLVLRIRDLDNGDALCRRVTAGTAALAVAQRVTATLRRRGVRARVASASDIADLDRRLGGSALEPRRRHWRTLRADDGWLTSYAYPSTEITTEGLQAAWTLNADAVTQNVTVFEDGTCCASVTVRTAQPPASPPSVRLKSLPGQQARALANTLCGPRGRVIGQRPGLLPPALVVPIGPSGILLGKVGSGDRLLLPLGDPAEPSRVVLDVDDAIAKRIVIRTAGAGERITVHSMDLQRWESVRMPHVVVTDRPRPAPGSTVSVTDGTVSPAPRPGTVIEVGQVSAPARANADIVITQTGPSTVRVDVRPGRRGAGHHDVEVEFFRAENRYAAEQAAMGRHLVQSS